MSLNAHIALISEIQMQCSNYNSALVGDIWGWLGKIIFLHELMWMLYGLEICKDEWCQKVKEDERTYLRIYIERGTAAHLQRVKKNFTTFAGPISIVVLNWGHVQYLDYCTRCNNYQRLRLRVKKTTLNLNH